MVKIEKNKLLSMQIRLHKLITNGKNDDSPGVIRKIERQIRRIEQNQERIFSPFFVGGDVGYFKPSDTGQWIYEESTTPLPIRWNNTGYSHTYYEMPPQQGWVCPLCGCANAPWLPSCPCSTKEEQRLYMKEIGSMEFWLRDDRDIQFNETLDCTFSLYGEDEDELLTIEQYWELCCRFAAAMGFNESTIEEWFGQQKGILYGNCT